MDFPTESNGNSFNRLVSCFCFSSVKPRETYASASATSIASPQTAGLSNIEITEGNIKAFEQTAKKYGIDFALKKDSTETPPRYLVFFKGRDADALTAAFKEFSAKKLNKEQKPSIRKALATFREAAKQLNANRQKTKHKDREVSL